MTTHILIGLACVLSAELGFMLGSYLQGKRTDLYKQMSDRAMKGWKESVDLLQKVAEAGGMVTDKSGNTLSPIQMEPPARPE